MKNRPLSVTVISWTLIIIGLNIIILTLLTMPGVEGTYSLANLPPDLFLVLAYGSAGICLFSGFFMLGGANWARYLFLAYGGGCLVWTLITASEKGLALPGLLIFALTLFFLFKPGSQAFFKPRAITAAQDHGIF